MATHFDPYFDYDPDDPDEGWYEDGRRRRLAAWLTGGMAGRVGLSLVVVSIVVAVASGVTGAFVSDEARMASVTTQGGTLDILVNGDADDTAVEFAGSGATITTNVSNMAPGDTAWGELSIDNAGSLPLRMTVSATGVDSHPDQAIGHCFSYFFREVGAAGSTTNGATLGSPVLVAGMGSAEGPDEDTALFETPVTQPLTDVGASSDDVWETDDVKTYRLTVRMRTECTQGGESTPAATGSLTLTFNAVQT